MSFGPERPTEKSNLETDAFFPTFSFGAAAARLSDTPHYGLRDVLQDRHQIGPCGLDIQSRVDKGEMQTTKRNFQFDTQWRGLKELHHPPGKVSLNVIAVHGLAAHPLKTWVRKSDTDTWNWLEHQLVEFIPGACVWIFGYESNWFGDEAISTNQEAVAVALLDGLHDKRHNLFSQPLLFIAHSFGGIVLMQAFVDAKNSKDRKNLFRHTEAILFFGTPFRGMDKWFTDEMPALAKIKHTQVQVSILRLMEQNSEALRRLRRDFSEMVKEFRGPGIGCFYETKSSNIGKIVDKLELGKATDVKRDRITLVTEDSATLEPGLRRSERPLPCDHFDMNEFGKDDSSFDTVKWVLHDIISERIRSDIPYWANSPQSSESSPFALPGPSEKPSSLLSGTSPETGDKPYQPDLSNWLEPALPRSFPEDTRESFPVETKELPKIGILSHSYSKAGLSPDCQSAYLLSKTKAEVYKSISGPAPQLLASMNHYGKLPWRCAAISNSFFVAANRETWLLWELRYSEMVEKFKRTVEPPRGINCLAIYEDMTQSTSQEILVAVGLRSGEGDVQEVQLYRINRNGLYTVGFPRISLVGTDPKMLSFSPDGSLLACTVYRQSREQYFEQVMVYEVKDAGPRDPVCTISMNFIQGQGGITSTTFWRSVKKGNCYILCTTYPDASSHEHQGQRSWIAPILIDRQHHPHMARHDLKQVHLRMHYRICAAAVAPAGDLIALLDTAGKLCLIPLHAGGLFGTTSATPKDYGISSDTSEKPLEVPNFKMEQNLDSQMVSLRFNEAGDKLFAVDHRRQIRIVHLRERAGQAKSLHRKASSFFNNAFHRKKM